MIDVSAASDVLGTRAERDAVLGERTTYRVGGAAALSIVASSTDDLAAVGRAAAISGLPVVVVGRGSNLLVADEGFPGIAVSLGDAFADVTIDGARVRAGAAISLPVLARQTAAGDLYGFEWAVGVPGSLGGAVRMNAGGHGSDMAASLVSAVVIDLATCEISRRSVADLRLGYRSSALTDRELVIAAELLLEPGDAATAEARLSEIVRWRREHQPGGQNSGSVFTNPPDDAAGRLIDAAGLKGFRIGTAEVSPKHANFIQADAGGRAADVAAVMIAVREAVRDRFSVVLSPEVRLCGFDDETVARLGARVAGMKL